MLSRLLVIILGVPIFIYILLSGKISFLFMNYLIILISIYEITSFFRNRGHIFYTKLVIFLSLLIPTFIYQSINRKIYFDPAIIIVFSFLLLSIYQIKNIKIKNSTNEIALSLFSIIYIPFLLSYMYLIRDTLENGKIIILFALFNVWAADTFAYIFGITIGLKFFKFKLSENISPNKSIEGLIGGIFGVLFTTYFFENILNLISYFFYLENYSYYINKNLLKFLILAILILIFSVFGDLFESKIKREFLVKDSSRILLGHGGVLDRIDSMLFVMPVVYYYIKFLF